MPENSFGKRQPGDQSVPLKESSGKPSGKGKDPLSQMAGLTLPQKIACLWPLILIFVGGFIGGACGGGACAINIQIMRGGVTAGAGEIRLGGPHGDRRVRSLSSDCAGSSTYVFRYFRAWRIIGAG